MALALNSSAADQHVGKATDWKGHLMNRIYKGKVTKVESKNSKGEWEALPKQQWQDMLWQHHVLFQDAVNYYTLALAAMVEGLASEESARQWIQQAGEQAATDPKHKTTKEQNKARHEAEELARAQIKAVLAWRDRVRDSWQQATRKAVRFDGPHARVAPVLGLDPAHSDFAACAKRILRENGSTAEARAAALLQLLQEADASDLNQMCVSRLPWFCTPKGQLDATPKTIVAAQESTMLGIIRAVHEAPASDLETIANKVELGYFVTQSPREQMYSEEAHTEAERLFEVCVKKFKLPAGLKGKFVERLDILGASLSLPRLGRKPKGSYPCAVVFKLLPCNETWECFKQVTASQYKRAQKGITPSATADYIAEARVNDEPLFDYFTNLALMREPEDKDRAVWFEFDLAAFIEAIKSPHRYFQDTIKREQAAAQLKTQIAAFEGRGRPASGEEEALPGFEDDDRIVLLRELVTKTLVDWANADATDEYTIQERTVRGFAEIKRRWLAAVEKGEATDQRLLDILAEEQGEHREDFGSATLYRALAQPRYQPIWRDKGTQPWHADDPLRAWLEYRELCRELEDKQRPIRFTPAHAIHSPRFFILPKQGRFGTKHEAGSLSFRAGMVLKTPRGWEPVLLRISYAAPRLRRDRLRDDNETDLENRPWLQPMMQALGVPDPDTVDFSNCRVMLQPASADDIQLTFPVEVSAEKLTDAVGKAARWAKQFNLHPDGDVFYNASLRWPHEKQPSKPPVAWHEALDRFSVLATDLGQRCAGAFARLEVRANDDFGGKPSRFIGETPGKKWRAAVESVGLFRLPGEEQIVWRRGDAGYDFLPELSGDRGRMPRPHEVEDTADLLRAFECPETDLMPPDWRRTLSFPEQNDKLLVAARRYQSRIARLHRWCWFLQDEKKRQTALDEIAEADDERIVTEEIRLLAGNNDPRLNEVLRRILEEKLAALPGLLIRLANRILPMRDRSWKWDTHPHKADCHLLTQTGPALPNVWIRGQRGLSMQRIEQIEELRRRFQSLNQTQRRAIGSPPPTKRDDSIPDCCPDLLEKLDHIKEQRANQTAHMILAEALGLRLAPPPADKRRLRSSRDVHGQYVKAREPVDFIVIEDLSRYRSSQGRAPRENSRLMKWCHRAVRDKLRELCEPFGMPVVETPAAYSSRFCSRSGVAGFRAVEVGPGFDREFPWVMLKDKVEDGKPTAEAKWVQELIRQVHALNEGRNGKPPRTLLAPQTGGPIFVPIVDKVEGADLQPAVTQADINAAINLGLRAIADPRLWQIHPRCRTLREGGEIRTREKRKFGEKGLLLSIQRAGGVKADDTHNPNFFADVSGSLPAWEGAIVDRQRLLSGRCLWSEVKKLQWQRCAKINAQRVQKWQDNLPM